MKEKELRLALVCYGGVSLVLYMQGVVKEFLKLIRASKAYHSIDMTDRMMDEPVATSNDNDGREHDTEAIYFSLLQAVGKTLDLRIIVDSIAGASAGGISGIILSRALAHDLSIDHLRSRWLEETDVLRLLAKSRRASAWSKWFLYPILWILLRSPMFGLVLDGEIRSKLSTFFRSRWFEAPFDGERFLELLLDGMNEMRPRGKQPSSLLPSGHRLDLAVAVTDFFGYPRRIRINTPKIIREREHSLLWTFTYCRWNEGQETSDFDDDGVPALALAARATSSLPGAFQPVQLKDMDRLLDKRGQEWGARSKFIERNFKEHIRADIDPDKTSFVDGGIVNDKPLSAAIDAIRGRAAYRDVDRRLIYIDPDPRPETPPPDGRVPSFWQTLEAAAFEIPLRVPIHEELERLAQFDESINRMRSVLEGVRPNIVLLVSEIIAREKQIPCTAECIGGWRKKANALAAERAGYAYQVYAQTKTLSVLDQVIALASDLGELDPNSPAQMVLAAEIRLWADRHGVFAPDVPHLAAAPREEHPGVAFLIRFDHAYRYRRLSFLMRFLNDLYAKVGAMELAEVNTRHLDKVKTRLQSPLHRLRTIRSGAFASSELRNRLKSLSIKMQAGAKDVARTAFADEIDEIMRRFADEFALATMDATVDHIVASLMPETLPEAFKQEMMVDYLGFSFWDVWTFQMSEWHELQEHREIRVDRISPADASTLGKGDLGTRLRGTQLREFAGFLSRSIRENDYLWGRLNGAERLIDIVCNAAEAENALAGIDVKAIKKSAFLSILNTEDRWLEDKKLLADVRELVGNL